MNLIAKAEGLRETVKNLYKIVYGTYWAEKLLEDAMEATRFDGGGVLTDNESLTMGKPLESNTGRNMDEICDKIIAIKNAINPMSFNRMVEEAGGIKYGKWDDEIRAKLVVLLERYCRKNGIEVGE